MRFLLDEGLPRSTVPALQGHDHVGALGMATARGEEILQKVRESGAVVVTLDLPVAQPREREPADRRQPAS